jgi:hypothetical protein
MKLARDRALIVTSGLLLVALLMIVALVERAPAPGAPHAGHARPTLLLLTSLPLVFGEDFSLEGGGSPALTALEKRYNVVPISVTNAADLNKGRLLLMAHPLAQAPENLVALDEWVRWGGHLLLLADPLLEWPSERPLGDPLRPPPMFMDTGLLQHWGLQLQGPVERSTESRKVGGYEVLTASPGALSGRCEITADRLVAHCRLGKGKATIIADADLLDVEHLHGSTEHNLDGVLAELERLHQS